jgi:hypothetical protein
MSAMSNHHTFTVRGPPGHPPGVTRTPEDVRGHPRRGRSLRPPSFPSVTVRIAILGPKGRPRDAVDPVRARGPRRAGSGPPPGQEPPRGHIRRGGGPGASGRTTSRMPTPRSGAGGRPPVEGRRRTRTATPPPASARPDDRPAAPRPALRLIAPCGSERSVSSVQDDARRPLRRQAPVAERRPRASRLALEQEP